MRKVGFREEGLLRVRSKEFRIKSVRLKVNSNLEYLESTELNAPGAEKVYLLVL